MAESRTMPSRSTPVVKAVSSIGLIGLIVLIAVPSVPPPVGLGLDASWIWGLNMAHAAKLLFGSQIVFTYGPLGYLAFPAFPEAEPSWVVLAFSWVLGALIAYALWQVSKNLTRALAWLYLGIFWLWSAALFVQPTASLERMVVATIALSLSVALRLKARPWIDLGFLYLLSAVGLLTKLSLAIAPLAIGLCFTLWLVWRPPFEGNRPWKQAALVILVFPAALFGLFWMADATPHGLVSYLRTSLDLANGYSDAMALAGPLWIVVLALGSSIVLLTAVPFLAGEPSRMALGFIPIGVLAFLSFKSAMVREDAHCIPFQFELALGALLLGALASTLRSRMVVAMFSLVCGCTGLIVQNEMWPQLTSGLWDDLTGRVLVRDVSAFSHWLRTVRALDTLSEQALAPAHILPESELSPFLAGKSVSAFPYQIDLIRSNHLQWQPLPVIQTYAAYTPRLDGLNADQLKGNRAPDDILLFWNSIDDHHPFYESPQTWDEIFDRYEIQAKTPELYLLKRRKTPLFEDAIAVDETLARWNEKITLPPVGDDQILLMRAEIEENSEGAIKRTLLRSPAIYVHATLHSGNTVSGRVVRMNANAGVIVSEWPRTIGDVVPMFLGSRTAPDNRVDSILFKADAPDLFRSVIRIHWLRQKLRPESKPEPLPSAQALQLTKLWTVRDSPPLVQNAETHAERDYLSIRSLNVDPQCLFTIGPQLGRYKTIMIRAKYQVSDRIDLFFGPQINGHGITGFVRNIGAWMDTYFDVAANPYWSAEHGTTLRFDPTSELGVNSTVDIAGIWGSPDRAMSSEGVFFAAATSDANATSDAARLDAVRGAHPR